MDKPDQPAAPPAHFLSPRDQLLRPQERPPRSASACVPADAAADSLQCSARGSGLFSGHRPRL